MTYIPAVPQQILQYGDTKAATATSKITRLTRRTGAQGSNQKSPYEEIDDFVKKLVDPGFIRKWSMVQEASILTYEIGGTRFCGNVGREHKSNNISSSNENHGNSQKSANLSFGESPGKCANLSVPESSGNSQNSAAGPSVFSQEVGSVWKITGNSQNLSQGEKDAFSLRSSQEFDFKVKNVGGCESGQYLNEFDSQEFFSEWTTE